MRIVRSLVAVLLFVSAPSLAQTLPGVAEAPPFEYFDGLNPDPEVRTPREHFGFEVGERFMRHHAVVTYVEHLGETNGRVHVHRYGESHQGRPLLIAALSSAANIERLDEILEANRRLADPRNTSAADARRIARDNPAIVWFSYNVHGNEPSTMDAGVMALYALASARSDDVARVLDDVVVVIDPCLNPDGRQRYVAWYENEMGVSPDANPDSSEHWEPWPQGRTNHYLFDLNRDWVWLTQPESVTRLGVYREYLPQLHIDFHEQGYTSPYFFGEGDTPYHANITDETKEWIKWYGRQNADAFDAQRLVYATAERFDYLYPGYGKVLPCYHGAVGLLIEKGGHSRAGLSIEFDEDRRLLTFRERTRQQFVVSMNYVEATAERKREQLERFHRYFAESMEPEEDGPKGFVISAANDIEKLRLLWAWCAAHGVEVRAILDDARVNGARHYRDGVARDGVEVPETSWFIDAGQPMGLLARTVLERNTFVEDPDTYDITSWTWPASLALEAWELTEAPSFRTELIESWAPGESAVRGSGDIALLVDSASHRFPVALGLVAEHGLFARLAGDPFTIGDRSFATGSLVIHALRNDHAALEAFESDCVAHGFNVLRAGDGIPDDGPALGNNSNRRFERPEILLARGGAFSALSFGQHWHTMDVNFPVPHSTVDLERMRSIDLDRYDTIVLPDGSGGSIARELGDSGVDRLKDWVRAGGTLVATRRAALWASEELLGLEHQEGEDRRPGEDYDASEEPDGASNAEREPLKKLSYQERRARGVEDRVSGVMMLVELDATHPINGGMGEWLGVVRRGDHVLPVADDGFVIARYADEPVISGAISERNTERLAGTPFVTHHSMGRGNVICVADDPTIRSFQHAGMGFLMRLVMNGASY
ncbi:MAG: M14 family metallopeptidase [Planctomycetota bacterium]